MSLQTGTKLGTVTGVIIDPRRLHIAAFYVGGPYVQGVSVLHTSDIREYGPLGFIVNGSEDIMELNEDLVRLQEVIGFNFTLEGKTVVDDTKKKLGKVIDFTLENDSFLVQKIHVGQSMVKNATSSGLIIHRSQIIEVTDSRIIVRSATIPAQIGLAQMLNPFRGKNQGFAAQESTRR